MATAERADAARGRPRWPFSLGTLVVAGVYVIAVCEHHLGAGTEVGS